MTRRPMSFRTIYLLGIVFAWFASLATAAAHEMKEMTINARIHADRVELRIVASNHMGASLLGSTDGHEVILNAATFANLRPALEAQGRTICSLWCDEKPARELPVTAIDTLLGQQDEVEFFVTYGPPTGATLSINANVLERIPDGYAITLVASDSKRKPLGAKALGRRDPSLVVPLSPPAREASPK